MNIGGNHHYFALSDMLLTISMLSNKFDENLDRDACSIIDFIGDAFEIPEEEKATMKKLALDDLTILSTTDDVHAYQTNNGEEEYPLISQYLYLKSIAISRLNDIYDYLRHKPYSPSFFDYRYLRPYYPKIRFNELLLSSSSGVIDITRTVGICYATGIGCEANIDMAITRLRQCVYWGDMTSIFYLAYLYKKTGDAEKEKICSALSSLTPYFIAGQTLLSKEDKQFYGNEVAEVFAIISSIKQDIVKGNNVSCIDYSFIEVLLSEDPKLDYYQKMGCINNYTSQKWKEITNSSTDPKKMLGFRIGKGAAK